MPQNSKPDTGDLDWIRAQARPFYQLLKGADLLLTGATGFFGKWLLESLVYLSKTEGLGLTIHAVSRDPEAFLNRFPHFSGPEYSDTIRWIKADVRKLKKISASKVDYVIHAATDTVLSTARIPSRDSFDTMAQGTSRVLNSVRGLGVKKFLLTSSGAAGFTEAADAYGKSKQTAEQLCVAEAQTEGFDAILARCFAFVGPYLPLDAHFAIGNFVSDALSGGPITVSGDGAPLRSYLYTSDLVIWLLTLMLMGESGRAYNVGSDQPISILDLAHLVARIEQRRSSREIDVVVEQSRSVGFGGWQKYVPSIEREKKDLGLLVFTPLEEAILRTLKWNAIIYE